jgi:hypothetical protein
LIKDLGTYPWEAERKVDDWVAEFNFEEGLEIKEVTSI